MAAANREQNTLAKNARYRIKLARLRESSYPDGMDLKVTFLCCALAAASGCDASVDETALALQSGDAGSASSVAAEQTSATRVPLGYRISPANAAPSPASKEAQRNDFEERVLRAHTTASTVVVIGAVSRQESVRAYWRTVDGEHEMWRVTVNVASVLHGAVSEREVSFLAPPMQSLALKGEPAIWLLSRQGNDLFMEARHALEPARVHKIREVLMTLH